jgi:DNA-binding MarR family transcriptional regulator
MSIFFWIAAHEGCRQETLAQACNMSTSSVSRCVTWLGPKHRIETRSGLKLVKRERDPDNHRAWRLYLTPKGKIFRQLLEDNATRKIPGIASNFYQTKKEIETYDKTDEDLG